jgi:predicted SAM-dependent methyltransferase
MKMLNVGCGTVFHNDWVNIDIDSDNSFVIKHDISKGLPFEEGTFNVVYCSHVLEHFEPDTTEEIIREIFRVLKKGGIVRILVPDLEQICRNYIKYLEDSVNGDKIAEFRYDYSLLEMFDQMVRTESGGRMGKLWRSKDIPDIGFIRDRNGITDEENIFKSINTKTSEAKNNSNIRTLSKVVRKCMRVMSAFRMSITRSLIRIFLGKEHVNYFRESVFRGKGEVHRFMYDRFSMARLLSRCGFREIKQCNAGETEIENFNKYQFEITGGMIRKPDSLYMEAIK